MVARALPFDWPGASSHPPLQLKRQRLNSQPFAPRRLQPLCAKSLVFQSHKRTKILLRKPLRALTLPFLLEYLRRNTRTIRRLHLNACPPLSAAHPLLPKKSPLPKGRRYEGQIPLAHHQHRPHRLIETILHPRRLVDHNQGRSAKPAHIRLLPRQCHHPRPIRQIYSQPPAAKLLPRHPQKSAHFAQKFPALPQCRRHTQHQRPRFVQRPVRPQCRCRTRLSPLPRATKQEPRTPASQHFALLQIRLKPKAPRHKRNRVETICRAQKFRPQSCRLRVAQAIPQFPIRRDILRRKTGSPAHSISSAAKNCRIQPNGSPSAKPGSGAWMALQTSSGTAKISIGAEPERPAPPHRVRGRLMSIQLSEASGASRPELHTPSKTPTKAYLKLIRNPVNAQNSSAFSTWRWKRKARLARTSVVKPGIRLMAFSPGERTMSGRAQRSQLQVGRTRVASCESLMAKPRAVTSFFAQVDPQGV